MPKPTRSRTPKKTPARDTREWLTLGPAYSRDYTTAEAVLEHWKEPKDFRIQDISSKWNGAYLSSREALEDEVLKATVFKVRFNKLEDFCLIAYENGEWRIIGTSD